MNIEDLGLSKRSYNALKEDGITTVEQLVNLDWSHLNLIPGIAKVGVNEICWKCIQLVDERVMERRIEWDKWWSSRPDNWEELKDKAEKYDAISNIVRT